MSNLNQAREWAEEHKDTDYLTPRVEAAIDLILSLPDHWVDVEKLRKVHDDMSNWGIPGMLDTTDSVRVSQMMDGFIDRLSELIAPKLPTLADMTAEERAACVGMQADYSPLGEPVERVAIVGITDFGAMLMSQNWERSHREAGRITPLPGEQKLEWPGSGDEPTISNKEKVADDQAVAKDVCNNESNSSETPKSSIKPEDVPPNEPWLIEADGRKAIGTRYKGDARAPWAVAALDGVLTDHSSDNEITLIHKLVPETHTLPKGMRIADHEGIGRVVTSPKPDHDGEYKVLLLDETDTCGAESAYLRKSNLKFLDGNQ